MEWYEWKLSFLLVNPAWFYSYTHTRCSFGLHDLSLLYIFSFRSVFFLFI
jgi:hypothetical protein